MAKQNVSFAERHLEKFIVGAAGAVLLGVIVYYGAMGPNKVEVAGERLGPGEFYRTLGEKAAGVKQTIKNRKAPELDPLPRLPRGESGTAVASKAVFRNGFGPGPIVPTATGSDIQGDQVLAEILPPKSLSAKAGMAYVAMSPMEVIRVGAGQTISPPAAGGANTNAIATDQVFVLLAAGLDRKAQSEKFRAANYDELRNQLVAAGLQAERRELGPDGKWSEPVLIRPGFEAYAPQVITGEPKVKYTLDDNRPVLSDADREYIDRYRNQLYSPESQNAVLRPVFQPMMQGDTKWQLTWQPPRKLPGFDFKMSDFGVVFAAEGDKTKPGLQPKLQPEGRGPMGPMGPMGPGARQRGPQNQPQPPTGPKGPVDLPAQKKARERLQQADAAIKAEKWLKALELLNEMLADQSTPEKERTKAQELYEQYKVEFQKALAGQEKEEERQKNMGIAKLGEDQEPVWLTDIKVEPGKTYQYRLRVIAFNEYAGLFKAMKDRADAERVLIEGQWSEWSEPVSVPATTQMYFTEVHEEGGVKKARVTVWSWQRGDWREGKDEVEVGEAVDFASGRDKFAYDGIVTGLDNGREFRPRNPKGSYDPPVKTDVLTLVSAAGQVEERLAAEDKIKNIAQRAWVQKWKDLLASQPEPPTGKASGSNLLNNPGPMGPMGPGRGGPYGPGGPMGPMGPGGRFNGRGGPYGPGGPMGPGGRDPRFGA